MLQVVLVLRAGLVGRELRLGLEVPGRRAVLDRRVHRGFLVLLGCRTVPSGLVCWCSWCLVVLVRRVVLGRLVVPGLQVVPLVRVGLVVLGRILVLVILVVPVRRVDLLVPVLRGFRVDRLGTSGRCWRLAGMVQVVILVVRGCRAVRFHRAVLGLQVGREVPVDRGRKSAARVGRHTVGEGRPDAFGGGRCC